MSEIRDKIKEYIVENFLFGDDKGLNDSTSFLESGIIDSTGILELIAFIEDAFSLRVNDDELIPENLDSITNLLRFISIKTGAMSTR
ncbi:MAG: acyl carrier protein [Geobacter sp.]|nr:acyl carrier protein [Geobacter sp.]